MFKFNDFEIQSGYLKFLDKVSPRFIEIEKFCDEVPEDNVGILKRMLYQYAVHTNFLSFNYSYAVRFYKIALAQSWSEAEDFKGHEERKVRAQVEAGCIEQEALMIHFDKLIRGLGTSLTAIQTAINAEKNLMSNRENG